MLMTTTTVGEGKPLSRYLGVVTGEAIIGANIFRDLFATVQDIDFRRRDDVVDKISYLVDLSLPLAVVPVS